MNNEVPKVVSKVGAEVVSTPVTGSLNVVVPGNFPSGSSKPTLISSIGELYKKFGVTSAPAAEDDTALLQASSLLSVTPVWCVRTHTNKVFEALTDSGERIFFDENKKIIRHRVNITVGVDTSIYTNMYIVCGGVCYYCGTQPEGVQAESFVAITVSEVGYDNFFKALAVSSDVYNVGDLCVIVENDGTYSVFTDKDITAMSSNLVPTGDTKTELACLSFGTDPYSQYEYVLINDNAYYNAGKSANPYDYPGTEVALPFINKSDEQDASAFAVYLYDYLMGVAAKKFISVNDIYLKRTLSNDTIAITTNIANLTYANGVLTLPPTSELASGKHIIMSDGTNKLIIHNGYARIHDDDTDKDYLVYKDDMSTAIEINDGDAIKLINCNTVYRLVEGISDYLADIALFFSDDSLAILDESNYKLYLDDGKMVSFSYRLPQSASVTFGNVVNTYKFGNEFYNTNNIKMTDCGILVGDTEYFVGKSSSATLSNNKVQIATNALSVANLIETLTRTLPNNYNATYEGNIISLFISTDERTATECEGGLAIESRDISFVDIESGNTFAVMLNSNSKAKIAQFSWVWDNDEELYTLTATVNGESYSRNIEFVDSTRVDGYGSSLYYDAFNRNFNYVTVVKIGSERSASSFDSPSFGNAVPIMEPNVTDVQTALNQLKSYKFTKFEILVDGGFVNPAYITVMDSICKDIKAVLYSGTKVSKYVSDIVEFRNNCPSNTWNTYLATPRLSDNTLGQFSVYMSPAIQYVKRIVSNSKVGDEFEAVFGATKGTVSGVPEFSFDPETDQETLIQSSVNTVYYSEEASVTYFNDNYTLVNEKSPMQEECIVRLINAAAHVSEVWLEINAIARKNNRKLREEVKTGITQTIENRLNSNITPYKDLVVTCDETNGNVDGSTTLYVTASCVPYGSVHRVELFTYAKALSSTEE